MLAYHAVVTDREFDGRFGLLMPMTMGDRANLEVMFRGGAKRKQASSQAALRRKIGGKGSGVSEAALNFWLNPDA